jgi:tetratricopeptide (TPR) repeat protein
VLRLSGLFDRPALPDCLAALRAAPPIRGLTDALTVLDEDGWRALLRGLERARLIRLSVHAGGALGLDAHPLVRDYFAEQLRLHLPAAFAAAHARLFEHLCAATPHRPDDLAGLQPLYQAVRHGCLAGRQQEACDKVYVERILRGGGDDGFYSMRKLGAIGADLGAVAAFFDAPWVRVSPNLAEPHRAWALNEAALRLRALGRLTEAVEPMRVGGEIEVRAERWTNAAIGYSNLSELELTLGLLPNAVTDARAAVAHADRSGDAFQRMSKRTTAADALHQSGETAEAGRLFAEAERMQRERQPQYPLLYSLLYSLQGFRYCDWLLTPAERAAWRVLGGADFQPAIMTAATVPPASPAPPAGPPVPDAATAADPDGAAPTDPLAACIEVERRATTALVVAEANGWLLTIALDHLTLARARLLRALLTGQLPPPGPGPEALAAVAGLRQAGMMNYLPLGLLTVAWSQALSGDPDAARAALDEALQIARRGPMPLFEAEVLLYRARLGGWASRPPFGDVATADRGQDAPAPSSPQADLAAARRLIEHHGYGRRLPELEDAEAALQVATADRGTPTRPAAARSGGAGLPPCPLVQEDPPRRRLGPANPPVAPRPSPC